MSQIKVKAIPGMIFVDEGTFNKIDEMKNSPEMVRSNPYIIAGKWRGNLSDITSLLKDPDVKTTNNTFNKIVNEYNQDRKKLLGQSAKQRSNNLGMFKLMFYTYEGKDPSTEVLDKARNVQESFFESNPGRCLCDANLLTPFMIKSRLVNGWCGIVRAGALSVIERAINEDMICNRLKK